MLFNRLNLPQSKTVKYGESFTNLFQQSKNIVALAVIWEQAMTLCTRIGYPRVRVFSLPTGRGLTLHSRWINSTSSKWSFSLEMVHLIH